MKIAIIGAGWTGLSLATRLIKSTPELTLFERDNQPGGLATFHNYGGFFWDRFYHVILPTDQALVRFLEEIGLGDKIRWKKTFTGVYVNQKFYSVSSTREFLLFPPLNLWQKFRLGLTILAGATISDWKKLEKTTVEKWLVAYSGRAVFEEFWKPLLLAKLGESYQRVSAVFIWTYIRRLFAARNADSSRQEKMGYLEGGYKTALDRMVQQLEENGATLRLSTGVEKLEPAAKGGLWLTAGGRKEHFDKIIFTGPTGLIARMADPGLAAIAGKNKEVEYLGVICLVLVLKKPLTPYYVLNIADPDIPFTGVIGMSTLVDTDQTNECHLVYLPKYALSGDPVFQKTDAEIESLFFRGIRKMYPGFREEDVVSIHVNRAFKVQPLQVVNYSEIAPRITSLHPDFYVLNTSQFLNDTLNNDSVIRHVNHFVQHFEEELKSVVIE